MTDADATSFLQSVFKNVKERKRVILVVGPQNAAKSTVVSMFLNKRMKAQNDDDIGEVRLSHSVEGEKPEIASVWGQACTIEPCEFQIDDEEGTYVWDCRSIFDKDVDQFPEHDIQNQYFNFLVSQNVTQIKFIFCIEQSSIINAQGLHFRNQTKNFSNYFNSVANFERSITMCSTKNNQRQFNQQTLGAGLLAVLSPFPIQKQIVKFMSQNVKLFPRLREETEEFTPDRNYFQELAGNIEYADILPNQFKFSVNDTSVELLNIIFDESHQFFFEVLDFIKQKIYEKCIESTNENENQNKEQLFQFRVQKEKEIQNPLFSQDGLIDEMQKYKEEYLQLLDLDDIYQLKTNLTAIKENINSENDGFLTISRNLKNLFRVIDKNEMNEDKIGVLNQKDDQGQQQVSFLRFFELVCERRIDRSRMEELIDQLISDVSKVQKKLLNQINLIQDGKNYQYYENMFTYFDQNDFRNFATMELSRAMDGQRKTISKCQYFMGVIMLEMNQLQDSLDHFQNAIEFYENHDCNEFPEIYQKIIAIFLKDRELLKQIEDDETKARLYISFTQNLANFLKEASDLIIEFSEERAVQDYDHYLDYLENIYNARLILSDLKNYNNASQNKNDIIENFNKLMDLICKKMKENDKNNQEQIRQNPTAQDRQAFNPQSTSLQRMQSNSSDGSNFQTSIICIERNQNNNIDEQQNQDDYQILIDFIKLNFKNNLEGQIFIDELTQQQFFMETNSWFKYLKDASIEADKVHKKVILDIKIDSEDYLSLSEKNLDRIIKVAQLHPKNQVAKKINSTALVCRGIQSMEKEKNQLALDFFEEALKVDNGLNKAREWAANLHFKEKQYKKAQELYLQIQFQEEVEKCFQKMIEKDPKNAQIREDKAQYFLQISLFDFAKKSYNEAIQIYSGKGDDLNMVRIYQEMDKIETLRCQKSQIYLNYVSNPDSIVPRTIKNQVDEIGEDIPNEHIQKNIMNNNESFDKSSQNYRQIDIVPVDQEKKFDSNLIVDRDLMLELYSFLNTDEKLNLIYRGSEDGFEATVFHDKCDKKGSTLTIARCKQNGTVFGGFTTVQWESFENGKVVEGNGESFIFTLRNGQKLVKLQCINQQREIWNSKTSLPSFGGMDLRLINNCNKSTNNFSEIGDSYQLPQGIEKDSEEAYQFITGIEEFTIDEIEVFQVKQSDQQTQIQFKQQKVQIFEKEKINNDEQKLISNIIADENMKNDLTQNINGFKSGKILYRASENSFQAPAFHEKCDYKGPTLTIARCAENGTIFGGFNAIQWEAIENGRVIEGNGDSFIFTFKNDQELQKLQCINKKREIWNSKTSLPSFGGMDLRLISNCNVSANNFSEIGDSYQLPLGIEKDSEEAYQFITGLEEFTVDEIEVFQVEQQNQLIQQFIQINDDEKKLNSKIIDDENLINNLIQNIIGFNYGKLLFRASENSFDVSAFHEKCDDKGPTLTIARNSENGTVFGGFTTISWQSIENGQMIAGNGNSFIFTIKNSSFVKLICINKDKEIWNSKNNMPSFGKMDIRLVNHCNQLDSSFAEVGNSYALPEGVEQDSQEQLEYLTGQEAFKVDEIEVFQILC